MSLKRLLCLVSVLGFVGSAWAGWEFTSVTKAESKQRGADQMNSTVHAFLNGDKSRVEFTEGKNPGMEKGGYLITEDGGKTCYMVHPKDKTYMKWDMEQMANVAGQATKMMQMKVTDPKVEKLLEEKGEKIAGFPTTHYRYRISYAMEMSIFGMKSSQANVQDHDVWSTSDVGDLGIAFWVKKGGVKMGDESLDKLMKAQMDQVKGFPLKQVTVMSSKDGKGNENVTKTTMEVTEIKKASPAEDLFKIPAGYKETSMFGNAGDQGEGEGGEGKDKAKSAPENPFLKLFQNKGK